MTKMIYRTEVKEMEEIRIKCGTCGTVIELGCNSTHTPDKCINCDKEMDKHIKEAIVLLRDGIKQYSLSKGFELSVQTEKE